MRASHCEVEDGEIKKVEEADGGIGEEADDEKVRE